MSVIMTYLLHFLCLCNYENRMRFGMVELETGIPFVSALTFRYLCIKCRAVCLGIFVVIFCMTETAFAKK